MRSLKKYIGAYMLKRLAASSQKTRRQGPLEEARRIGIVYQADALGQNKSVTQLVRELNDNGKIVKTLGYIDLKSLPPHSVPNEKNDFFCRKDLNTYNLPKEEAVKRFTQERFDLLLNLYTQPEIILLGVSMLSEATVRVGPYFKGFTCCMDMMLEYMPPDELSALIESVKTSLKEIL